VFPRPQNWQKPLILIMIIVLIAILTWAGTPVGGIVAILGAATAATFRITAPVKDQPATP
jgi:protein-S-isoprenylcysteine O-methyltransferase Ste14